MTSRTNLAILVVFTALVIVGATMALSTAGFFNTTGISSAYAQNETGNMTIPPPPPPPPPAAPAPPPPPPPPPPAP